MSELGEERNIKGYRFQNEIRDKLESITSKYWWCETLIEPRVNGQSKVWTPDLAVAAEHVITGDHLYLAIIECTGVSSPVYLTRMSRAYIMAKRRPERGESPRLNYSHLFNSVKVELVHGDNTREMTGFEEQIDRLCRESSPVKQLEAMGPDELEKFSLEVQKKAIERSKKEVDELRRL